MREPCCGVAIRELKKIQKRIRKDDRLALELYDAGVYGAMYLAALKRFLQRVQKTILQAPDLVRYQMNGFVIAVGGSVVSIADTAIQTSERIGPVTADLGNHTCQMPFAPDCIRKMQQRGTAGKKRKTATC